MRARRAVSSKALAPEVGAEQDVGREQTGNTLLCDIVGFSEKPDAEQRNAVRAMSEWLQHHIDDHEWRRSEEPYVNCTGDGFILAIDEEPLRHGKGAEW